MLLSNQFIQYLNSQKDIDSIKNVCRDIQNLQISLRNLKQELAEDLPKLFMNNDEDAIQQCISYGKEIDSFISELKLIDIVNETTEDYPTDQQNNEPEIIEDDDSEEDINIESNESTKTNEDAPHNNDENNKTEPLKSQDVRYFPSTKMIKLGIVYGALCPKCGSKMKETTILYSCFTDKSRTVESSKARISAYRCRSCGKYYILNDILSKIENIECTNIEPVHIYSQSSTSKKNKTCIQCNEPVWNGSDYCWEHYKYHNAESK